MRYGKRVLLLPAAAAVALPVDDGFARPNASFSTQEIEDGLHLYQTTLERPVQIDSFGDPSLLGDRLVFLAPHDGGIPAAHNGALITTPAGEPIWTSSAYGKVHDLLVQPYGPDGAPHLTFWAGSRQSAAYSIGKGHGVVLDASYSVVARLLLPAEIGSGDVDLHEFRIAEWGGRRTAMLSTQRTVSSGIGSGWGTYVVDTCVYEIDVESSEVVWNWCPADHVSRDDSYQLKLVLGFLFSSPYDFFHLNSVQKDADGNYLISGRCMHALYLVSPAGEIIWTLGGHAAYGHGDFAVEPGSGDVSFGWQHHASLVDPARIPSVSSSNPEEGVRYVSLFDNGNSGFLLLATRSTSRGLVLRLDEKARTVRLVGAYPAPVELEGDPSSSQGSVEVLESGDVFVGYGKRPWYALYSLGGEMKMSGRLALDAESYRTIVYPWKGMPAYPPSIGVCLHGDDAAPSERNATDVYVSWNGATHVSSYRLLGGPSSDPSSLTLLFEAPKAGFETVLRVPSHQPPPQWLAVAALDADGAVLGTSDVHSASINSTLVANPAGAAGNFGPPTLKAEWKGKIEPLGGMLFLVQRWVAGAAEKLGFYR